MRGPSRRPSPRDAAPLFAALRDEQAISKHLDVLSDAGLVRSTWRGRERVWDLAPERLADANEYLNRISRMWDQAIDRLRAFVETAGE